MIYLCRYPECGRGLEILNVELAQCYLAAGAGGSTDSCACVHFLGRGEGGGGGATPDTTVNFCSDNVPNFNPFLDGFLY